MISHATGYSCTQLHMLNFFLFAVYLPFLLLSFYTLSFFLLFPVFILSLLLTLALSSFFSPFSFLAHLRFIIYYYYCVQGVIAFVPPRDRPHWALPVDCLRWDVSKPSLIINHCLIILIGCYYLIVNQFFTPCYVTLFCEFIY